MSESAEHAALAGMGTAHGAEAKGRRSADRAVAEVAFRDCHDGGELAGVETRFEA